MLRPPEWLLDRRSLVASGSLRIRLVSLPIETSAKLDGRFGPPRGKPPL